MLQALLVVTLLATMCASAQAQGYDQLEKWCYGDDATDDQTIQGCSAVITSGRATGKRLFRAFYDRGLAFLNTNQFDRAIEDFGEAIKLDPTDADAFNNRGDAYRSSGGYVLAINDYDQAIKLRPDFAEAFNHRGMAQYEISQVDHAIEDYDQAIKLDPNYAEAFNNRGNAYESRKQYDRAIQDFDQALKLEPDLRPPSTIGALSMTTWARPTARSRTTIGPSSSTRTMPQPSAIAASITSISTGSMRPSPISTTRSG